MTAHRTNVRSVSEWCLNLEGFSAVVTGIAPLSEFVRWAFD